MTPSSWLPGLRSSFARNSLRERVATRRSATRRRHSSFETLEDRLVFALTLDIIPPTVTETWGFFAATIYRTGNLSQPLTVNLSSSDTGKATAPANVQIPANAVSKNFNITIINDTRLDDDTIVTITARTNPDDAVTDSFTVINDDYVTLRPAPANDTVIVAPTATAGQLSVTPGPWEPEVLGPTRAIGFAGGSMIQTAAVNTVVESTEFLPVDLTKTYALTGWAKSGDELGQRFDVGNRQSFGFQSYDADHFLIRPEHVLRHLGSIDTRLAAPLNPGDTVIRLVNASGWSNGNNLAATRGIAWYGYQDSHGTTVADYTYTRNVALGGANGLWSPGGINGNVITLSAPWSGPALAAGTAVRNTGAGSDANWSALRSQSVGGDWTWTKHGDLPFDVNNPFASLGILPADAIRAAFADGRVHLLPADVSAAELSALVTLRGEELVDAAAILAREAQRTGQITPSNSSASDLRQIALAMHAYYNSQKKLPISTFASDGTPLLSWRVHILPFMGYGALYSEFHRNEPWDSPHNLSLLKYMPDVFCSAGDPADSVSTRVQGFTGPGAPFPATGTNTTQGLAFAQIADGSSNTIAFAEVGSDHAVPWTKPSDTPFNPNNPFSALGDISTVLLTAMLDGSVQSRSRDISLGELRTLITYNGHEDNNNPPAFSAVPAFFVHQSAGNTVTNEFGADWFDVVLDKAPLSNVVLSVGLSNAALAAVDKPTVTFTPENWNVPQRVTLRPVDNHVEEPDVTVDVTITVVDAASDNAYDPAANQTFTARILDDDARPALAGDYNLDSVVDATDYTVWRDTLGATGLAPFTGADGDGDGQVTQNDWSVWRTNFGSRLEPQELLVGGSGSGSVADDVAPATSVAAAGESHPAAESPAPRVLTAPSAALSGPGYSDPAPATSILGAKKPTFASAPLAESHDAALLLLAIERDFELPATNAADDKSADAIDAALTEETDLVAVADGLVDRVLD